MGHVGLAGDMVAGRASRWSVSLTESIFTLSVGEGTPARKVRLAHARGEESSAHSRTGCLVVHYEVSDISVKTTWPSTRGSQLSRLDAPCAQFSPKSGTYLYLS